MVYHLVYKPYKHGGMIGEWVVRDNNPVRKATVADIHDGTLRPGTEYLFKPFTDKNMYRSHHLTEDIEYKDFKSLIEKGHVYVQEK